MVLALQNRRQAGPVVKRQGGGPEIRAGLLKRPFCKPELEMQPGISRMP
jgi:hypothetical protein